MTRVVEFPDRRVVAEEAAEWLIRLDADTPPSREELLALGEWLRRSPAHRQELESLAALWGHMNVLTELALPLANSSRPAAPARLGEDVARKRLLWRPGLLAASLAAMLALGWVLLTPDRAKAPLVAINGLYATAVGQTKTETLADGSQVVLNTNSQIHVEYGVGFRKVHLLQGEALFTVAKNAQRPFRVYAGNGRIEAVGTAFSVYLDGKDVSVAVTEGRVSLASSNRSESIAAQRRADAPHLRGAVASVPDSDDSSMESLGTLDAGHVARIRNSSKPVAGGVSALESIQSVAPEQLAQRLAWREGTLLFSGETLEEVVKEFARYTTVSIEIPDEAVRRMRIGGRFPAGETETLLATLQTSFNLRVTRVGQNRVIISAADE